MKNNYKKLVLVLSIVLIASNLRPSLTSISPLIHIIMKQLSLNASLISLLTTVPLMVLGLLSPVVPLLCYKLGDKRIILIGLAILSIGICLRASKWFPLLLLGSLLLGSALAILNVSLPGIIKNNFSNKVVGGMTSLYSTIMGLFAAIAPGISSFLTFDKGFRWQISILLWIIFAIIAFISCFFTSFNNPNNKNKKKCSVGSTLKINIWKSKIAWQVALFMGLQSVLFYSLFTWFSTILLSKGYSSSQAGLLLTIMGVSGLPTTFIVPLLSSKGTNQKNIVFIISIAYIIGLSGILSNLVFYMPAFVILLGLAQGASISLSYILISLRTDDPVITTKLSGMAQSVGYLLAAAGPLLLGLMHDVMKSWNVIVEVLIIVCTVMFVVGLKATEEKLIK